jgi:hypothetical protein
VPLTGRARIRLAEPEARAVEMRARRSSSRVGSRVRSRMPQAFPMRELGLGWSHVHIAALRAMPVEPAWIRPTARILERRDFYLLVKSHPHAAAAVELGLADRRFRRRHHDVERGSAAVANAAA